MFTIQGAPSALSLAGLHMILSNHLSRRSVPLLISLSAMTTTDPGLLAVIAAITEPCDTPPVTIVLQGESVPGAQRLRQDSRLPRAPLCRALAAAKAVLMQRHEAPRSLTESLLPMTGAARQGRNMATEACLRWDQPHLLAAAVPVASELITHAIRCAGTLMSFTIATSPTQLYLAVRHGRGTTPQPDEPSAVDDTAVLGLHLVNALADHWEFLPNGHDTITWAAIARAPT